ncbi:unnamed protein product [Chrysoparadoxa australica]
MGKCKKAALALLPIALGLFMGILKSPNLEFLGSGEMFDTIAPQYDTINRLMSLGLDTNWRKELVEGLQLKPGDRVLDLGTGERSPWSNISHPSVHLSVSCQVTGVDPSSKMIELGRGKIHNQDLGDIVSLQLGDAEKLELQDGSFDKIAMSFAIRNVPDRKKALKEVLITYLEALLQIYRVASKKAGTIVGILEFHMPQEGLLAPVAAFVIKHLTPLFGTLVGAYEQYQHLQKSIFEFPSPSLWTEAMGNAGLRVFDHKVMCQGVVHLYLASVK